MEDFEPTDTIQTHLLTVGSSRTGPPLHTPQARLSTSLLLAIRTAQKLPVTSTAFEKVMAEATRSTGTVKWFSAQKGFGFIAPDDGGDDLFVHQTSIRFQGFRTLSENQPVEFTVDYAEDGRAKAADVTAIPQFRRPSHGTRGGGRGRVGGYRQGGYGGSSGACYNCGRMGHLARDCYRSSGDVGGGSRRYGNGVGGGAGGAGRCYNCGDEGHFARDCANK